METKDKYMLLKAYNSGDDLLSVNMACVKLTNNCIKQFKEAQSFLRERMGSCGAETRLTNFVFSNVNVRFFLLEEIPDDSLEEKTLLYLEKFFEDVEEADDYIVVNQEDCNCIFMNGYLAHSYADTAYVDGAGRVSFKGFNGVNNFHSADFKLSDLE